MYSSVMTADLSGVQARVIRVEADVNDGLPVFDMVGYLASAVKEARERVRIAVRNAGIRFPAKRITVNLSPANLRKEGTSFDLSIAISLLNAFGYLADEFVKDTMFIGELGLDGSVRGVKGVLAMIQEGIAQGIHRFVVPEINACEGAFLEGIEVYGVLCLEETIQFLKGDICKEPIRLSYESCSREQSYDVDFSEMKGCSEMKRAAEIAVSGRHNLLMVGPPGTGKTMLARRLPTIMPQMSMEESLSVTRLYSISGLLDEKNPVMTIRPFRAPHHTLTPTALTGGGRIPVPGEISLASEGILFLDELPEFDKDTLEVLRQPLEEHRVSVSRVGYSYDYPANCMFVAAMNPCRCGFYPDRDRCHCTISQIQRYISRISQPLLDRMDLCVQTQMPKIQPEHEKTESSAQIRQRVERAVAIQKERYQKEPISYNYQLSGERLEHYCALGSSEQKYMEELFMGQAHSMRGIARILRVARTIADMQGSEKIKEDHLTEAVYFRSMSREYWG